MARRLSHSLLLALIVMLGAASAAAQQQDALALAPAFSVAQLLAAAQSSLAALEQEVDQQTRDIQYRAALASLTGLLQLHGCRWAQTKLDEITSQPDFPATYYGIAADGRLAVMIDRLELRNEALAKYTVYLCTLESLTAQQLKHDPAAPAGLQCRLRQGGTLTAEVLTPDHELWPQIGQLAPTFDPPAELVPGSAVSFKQAFVLPAGHATDLAALELTWGAYALKLPVYSK